MAPLKQNSSKKAFESNLKREIGEGKPKDQGLAISYAIQKRNKAKKKMADGGTVDKPKSSTDLGGELNSAFSKASKPKPAPSPTPDQYAAGGEVRAATSRPSADSARGPRSMKMMKRMADGGIVENEYGLDMLDAHSTEHDQEVRAASERPDADDGDDAHSKAMLEGASTMDGQELDARKERMSGIDSEMDSRSQAMRRGSSYEHGGEIDWAANEPDADNEETSRSENMLDSHETMSAQEKRAGSMDASADDEDSREMQMLAEGGKASLFGNDMSSKIRDRMARKRFADGGQVDLSRNADEDLNNEDQMSFEVARKENYSESAGLDQLDQPEDSNLHGHDLSDEDEHERSMIDEIRATLKKRGMAR